MVKIVEKLGSDAFGKCSEIHIINILEELRDFTGMHEYDGVESLYYKIDEYKISKITDIINEYLKTNPESKLPSDILSILSLKLSDLPTIK